MIFLHLPIFGRPLISCMSTEYIPTENGPTTEVDVLLLHTSGIYVFEALSPYGEFPYHSFILFSDRCKLKKIHLASSKAAVMHRSGVREGVRRRASETGMVLDAQQIQQIYQKLYPYTQVSELAKQLHIKQIQKKYASAKQAGPAAIEHKAPPETKIPDSSMQNTAAQNAAANSNPPICPRCGKLLVLRVARSGAHAGQSFWGCSGFPKCRYTRQIISASNSSAKQ